MARRFFYLLFMLSQYKPIYWKNLVNNCKPKPRWQNLLIDFLPFVRKKNTYAFRIHFW